MDLVKDPAGPRNATTKTIAESFNKPHDDSDNHCDNLNLNHLRLDNFAAFWEKKVIQFVETI